MSKARNLPQKYARRKKKIFAGCHDKAVLATLRFETKSDKLHQTERQREKAITRTLCARFSCRK
jgi:hypothetical protein